MSRHLDRFIYWLIVLIPFSIAIAPAPMNIIMGLLIGAFLIKKMLKREPLFQKAAIGIPLLFLLMVTCVSLFNSVSYRDSIKGGIMRLMQYIFILSALAQEVKDKKHMRRIVFSVFLGLTLLSFDEIFQVITGRDFIRGYGPVINLGLIRATASFKDSNTLGIYLSAFMPILLGLALFYYRGKKKFFVILLSLLALTGAALTYSRPTLLAIYVALFFLSVAKKDKRMIAILMLVTLIAPFALPRAVKNWAREVEYNPLRFMCNDDRIAIYRNSINMIKHNPLVGVGANTYMKNYRKYKESPEYRNVITGDYMYAHNNFLHMAAEIGLIGLGIFIWMLYGLFNECIRIYRNLDDTYIKALSLSLLACLVSFLVNGLTESSLYYSRVAILFWYLAGFSLALKKFTHGTKTKKDTGSAQ